VIQVLKRYSLCVIDPEGDYTHLDALPGVIVYPLPDDKDPFPMLEPILRQPALSLVVDMSTIPPRAKPALVRELLQRVNSLRRSLGVPHCVVLDEAHYLPLLVLYSQIGVSERIPRNGIHAGWTESRSRFYTSEPHPMRNGEAQLLR
jgi:hypothetical protein